jgi:hypothetical protein
MNKVETTHRAKCAALSVFGDVATVMGPAVERYLRGMLSLLDKAAQTEVLEGVQPTIDPQLVRDIEELPTSEVPLGLRDDVARRKQRKGLRRKQRWDRRWARFTALLLCVFGAQIVWASRAILLERFPVASPWLEQACAFAGCRAHPPAPPPTIELQARDVREHPQYQNALLVNASLINREPKPAPFPVLQLGIFDQTGTLIGIRRFKPGEYLDESFDLASGIAVESDQAAEGNHLNGAPNGWL